MRERWIAISAHHQGVAIDEFAILPDHFHGILFLPGTVQLATVVGSFKSSSSRLSAAIRSGPLWQRGYHDRVIRNDVELDAYREYIVTNQIRHDLEAAGVF